MEGRVSLFLFIGYRDVRKSCDVNHCVTDLDCDVPHTQALPTKGNTFHPKANGAEILLFQKALVAKMPWPKLNGCTM